MLVDTADLLNSSEVAEIIGIVAGGVSVYHRRHSDFPKPVIDKGRCVLWLRPDVEAWQRSRVSAPPADRRAT